MRPSRLAVSWGSLFLLTRPASNSANQARNLASSAGGSRRIASSISSTVIAAGIARRPQSLKNQWLANRDVTVFRRPVIEVGKQGAHRQRPTTWLGWEDSNSEMSTQICAKPAEFWPGRPFPFELRCWDTQLGPAAS